MLDIITGNYMNYMADIQISNLNIQCEISNISTQTKYNNVNIKHTWTTQLMHTKTNDSVRFEGVVTYVT